MISPTLSLTDLTPILYHAQTHRTRPPILQLWCASEDPLLQGVKRDSLTGCIWPLTFIFIKCGETAALTHMFSLNIFFTYCSYIQGMMGKYGLNIRQSECNTLAPVSQMHWPHMLALQGEKNSGLILSWRMEPAVPTDFIITRVCKKEGLFSLSIMSSQHYCCFNPAVRMFHCVPTQSQVELLCPPCNWIIIIFLFFLPAERGEWTQ